MAISQAKAPRQASKRPFRMIKGVSVLSDLADGAGAYGYPGDYPGQIYYVNNITGDSEFDGLSWETPFAQPSEAITASETFRALPSGTTNDYVRNIIFIQGTGTSYTNITALPQYCDMVGIGADPRGDGTGIVVIKGVGVDGAAGNSRGLGLYNIQFSTNGSFYAMDVTVLLRSTIENCVFGASTANSSAPITAAFRASSHFAGNTIRNCVFGNTNGTYGCNIGFDHSGGVGNNNLFENNFFMGIVHAVKVGAAINDNGALWKNNVMHSHLGATQPTTAGLQMGAHSIAAGNFVCGADAITEAAAAQTLGNVVVASGNGIWETELA